MGSPYFCIAILIPIRSVREGGSSPPKGSAKVGSLVASALVGAFAFAAGTRDMVDGLGELVSKVQNAVEFVIFPEKRVISIRIPAQKPTRMSRS